MTLKIKKRNFITNVVLNISLFRIIYICVLFLTSFCYVDVICTVIKYPLMIWGCVLLNFYYIRPKRIGEVMYARWILCFLIASLSTNIIHCASNFMPNMGIWIHMVICFFLLYGMHTERNRKRKQLEIYRISSIILISTTISMILSFLSLFFGEHKGKFAWNTYNMVIYENRFTGIFTNPNLLAFYAVVAIVFAHILDKDNLYIEGGAKRIFKRWFLVLCVIINLIGLFLSDSNGSLLLIACYIIGNILYYLFGAKKNINIKNFLLRTLSAGVALVLCVGMLLGLRIYSNKAVSMIINTSNSISKSEVVTPIPDNEDIIIEKDIIKPNKNQSSKEKIVTFAHENENLDSGRIKLLENAVVIFYNNPIFGVGKENIVLYGEKLIEKGMKYNDLHNGYLTILVSYGLIGFILFIGFAVSLGNSCVKSVFLEKQNLLRSPYICLFSFIFAYCIYAVVEKTILLEQSYMVVIFWYMLGYLSCYMQKYDHTDERFSIRHILKIKISNKTQNQDINKIDVPTDEG